MKYNLRDAMTSLSQPRDQLENRRSKDNKMFGKLWRTIENSIEETGVREIKGDRSKRRARKRKRKDRATEERKKEEDY